MSALADLDPDLSQSRIPAQSCGCQSTGFMGWAKPHDTLFHLTFHHAHHAAGWLRSVLPGPLAAAIDWASLHAAPEKVHGHALRFQVTDTLFEVALRPHGRSLFVVPEHKSCSTTRCTTSS